MKGSHHCVDYSGSRIGICTFCCPQQKRCFCFQTLLTRIYSIAQFLDCLKPISRMSVFSLQVSQSGSCLNWEIVGGDTDLPCVMNWPFAILSAIVWSADVVVSRTQAMPHWQKCRDRVWLSPTEGKKSGVIHFGSGLCLGMCSWSRCNSDAGVPVGSGGPYSDLCM